VSETEDQHEPFFLEVLLMAMSMGIQIREAPHGLLRVESWPEGETEPSVRYLPRGQDGDRRPEIIRLDRQAEEPVCRIGGLKVFVRAYPDRVEIVLVPEGSGLAAA
jgi:hypothetical protein